uniref:Uncharacterized protein n=1 Tax=Arundo donax TaxID=35708 RepID=A0A0A9CLY9_ARUDO
MGQYLQQLAAGWNGGHIYRHGAGYCGSVKARKFCYNGMCWLRDIFGYFGRLTC